LDIGQKHRPIRSSSQPFSVCGRDTGTTSSRAHDLDHPRLFVRNPLRASVANIMLCM
jgi:hypothetical protein